jgi:hypothetical protein
MRSPCCVSVHPSVSVRLSVYPPTQMIEAYEAYDIASLSVCLAPQIFVRRLLRSLFCLFALAFRNFFGFLYDQRKAGD